MEAFSAETKQEWGSARKPVPDLRAQGPTWSLGPEVPWAGAVLGPVLTAHVVVKGRVLPLLLSSSLLEPALGLLCLTHQVQAPWSLFPKDSPGSARDWAPGELMLQKVLHLP